jgi:uncharacterized protein
VSRVTADSNIYISAFLHGGKPLELLETARAGQSELAVTDDILNEIGRVLGTKFNVPGEDVQAFRGEILTFATLVTPGERLDAVPADPTDNRILECAVTAGSEVIVSGDKHLLGLGTFRGIEIVSVNAFLQRRPDRQR